MANFYATDGLNPTAQTPGNRLESYDLGGKLRFATIQYTAPASGTPQIGDVIIWIPSLPKGARVLAHLSRLDWSAGTASSTATLGDGHTANRYLAATAITSAGGAAGTTLANGATYVTGTNASDTQIQSTIAGAAVAASQVITLRLAYVQD